MAEKISRSTFDEIAQNFDDVRDDYSGRGMYGKNCLAIVLNYDESAWTLRGEIQDILDGCVEFGMPDEADEIRVILEHAPEEDSMGLGTVYYWPRIQVEEA